MMRIFFVCTLVLIALLVSAFYYVFYTPALILKALPSIAEQYFKEGTINAVHIGGQLFEYPEVLKLLKIKADVRWKDEDYYVEIQELDILNFQTLWRLKKQAVIRAVGLTVQRKNFDLQNGELNATVNFSGETVSSYNVVLKNGTVNLNPYRLSGVSAKFDGTPDVLKISEIGIQAYGGQAKGQVDLEFRPRRSETAVMEFNGLKSEDLQALNKTIFSQLTGELSGTFRLSRVDQQIQVLVILAEIRKGGTLGKSLCKKLVSYMTDEANRYSVENFLENQGKIIFDQAEFRILNVSQNLAGVTVTLLNKKEDFRIHETINVDISRILKNIAWKN